MTINELFEESGKQYGVVSADYGIQEIDLSREISSDTISLEKEIAWPDLETDYPTEAEFILEQSDAISEKDSVSVYTATSPNGESYLLLIPSWWD